ncbi:MAG: hypothetical protein WC637_20260, partial [Victivallales bacterium]
MRYYKQNRPQSRPFLSPTGSFGSAVGDQGCEQLKKSAQKSYPEHPRLGTVIPIIHLAAP